MLSRQKPLAALAAVTAAVAIVVPAASASAATLRYCGTDICPSLRERIYG